MVFGTGHRDGIIKVDDIKEYIERKIDGDDYERGSVESARATADNAGKVIANLVFILRKNGLLQESEINEITEGIY